MLAGKGTCLATLLGYAGFIVALLVSFATSLDVTDQDQAVIPAITTQNLQTDVVVRPLIHLQKRGLPTESWNPLSSRKARMLKVYQTKAERTRRPATELSETGNIDRRKPLKTKEQLQKLLYAGEIGLKDYKRERAHGRHIINLLRVEALEKGDWKGMNFEANRKRMQQGLTYYGAGLKEIASKNSAAKARLWARIAQGKRIDHLNQIGPHNKLLIRPASYYRDRADALRKLGDTKSEKYKKNVLRATALEMSDKGLARQVAAGYVGKASNRLAISRMMYKKSRRQEKKADAWEKVAGQVKKQEEKVLRRQGQDIVRDLRPDDQTNAPGYRLQKRGFLPEYFKARPSFEDKMLSHYTARVIDTRGPALATSENGEIDRETPLKTNEQLRELIALGPGGFKVYTQERNRARYVKSLSRVEMLQRGDWRRMQDEASRKYLQQGQTYVGAGLKEIAGQNTALKEDRWTRIAQGQDISHLSNVGPHLNPLVRPAHHYRKKAFALQQQGDVMFDEYKKNINRATALEMKDKGVARDIAAAYSAKAAGRIASSEMMYLKAKEQQGKAEAWDKVAKRVKKHEMKSARPSEQLAIEYDRSDRSMGPSTALLQKRGYTEASSSAQAQSHTEKLLEKQRAKVEETRKAVLATQPDAGHLTPLKSNTRSESVSHQGNEAFEHAYANHLHELDKWKMLHHGDHSGMLQEAARLHMQGEEQAHESHQYDLASVNSALKARVWRRKALGEETCAETMSCIHDKPLIRDQAYYHGKAEHAAKILRDPYRFKKNKFRAVALKTKDADLYQDVANSYLGKSMFRDFVSHSLRRESDELKKQGDEWKAASLEALKKKHQSDEPSTSSAATEGHQSQSNIKEDEAMILHKRGIAKPDRGRYYQKASVYKQNVITADKKLAALESSEVAPDPSVLQRAQLEAEHFHGKLTQNERKAENMKTPEGLRFEAGQYHHLMEYHKSRHLQHLEKAERLDLRKQVWENQAAGDGHLNDKLMKQFHSTGKLVHDKDKYARNVVKHQKAYNAIPESKRLYDPEAVDNANRMHRDIKKVSAMETGGREMAEDLAREYTMRIAAHRDSAGKALKNSNRYGEKAKMWDRLAKTKEANIAQDLREEEEDKKREQRAKDKLQRKAAAKSPASQMFKKPFFGSISTAAKAEKSSSPVSAPGVIGEVVGTDSTSLVKRGVYEKPSFPKYAVKKAHYNEEAFASEAALNGQPYRSGPDASEADRQDKIHQGANGGMKFVADRAARKLENNQRKEGLFLRMRVPELRTESARYNALLAEHSGKQAKHLNKANRAQILRKVWENQADGKGHLNGEYLKKQKLAYYVHSADRYDRKAKEHGANFAMYSEEEQASHTEAIKEREKKEFNELRATALRSGDKSLARQVAQKYKVKNVVHRDMAEIAAEKADIDSTKAKDWSDLANKQEKVDNRDKRKKEAQKAKALQDQEKASKKDQARKLPPHPMLEKSQMQKIPHEVKQEELSSQLMRRSPPKESVTKPLIDKSKSNSERSSIWNLGSTFFKKATKESLLSQQAPAQMIKTGVRVSKDEPKTQRVQAYNPSRAREWKFHSYMGKKERQKTRRRPPIYPFGPWERKNSKDEKIDQRPSEGTTFSALSRALRSKILSRSSQGGKEKLLAEKPTEEVKVQQRLRKDDNASTSVENSGNGQKKPDELRRQDSDVKVQWHNSSTQSEALKGKKRIDALEKKAKKDTLSQGSTLKGRRGKQDLAPRINWNRSDLNTDPSKNRQKVESLKDNEPSAEGSGGHESEDELEWAMWMKRSTSMSTSEVPVSIENGVSSTEAGEASKQKVTRKSLFGVPKSMSAASSFVQRLLSKSKDHERLAGMSRERIHPKLKAMQVKEPPRLGGKSSGIWSNRPMSTRLSNGERLAGMSRHKQHPNLKATQIKNPPRLGSKYLKG